MTTGDEIKFKSGPFRGLLGKIESDDDGTRVYNVRLYQYDRKFAVSYDDVNQWIHPDEAK